MKLNKLEVIGILGVAAIFWTGGCATKPCESVPLSTTAQRMGVALDGAHVCKDERNAVTLEYPNAKGDELHGKYLTAMQAADWKTETVSPKTVLATRGADTLFIVTASQSQDRKIPFAMVKYCDTTPCSNRMKAIAAEMAKIHKKVATHQ